MGGVTDGRCLLALNVVGPSRPLTAPRGNKERDGGCSGQDEKTMQTTHRLFTDAGCHTSLGHKISTTCTSLEPPSHDTMKHGYLHDETSSKQHKRCVQVSVCSEFTVKLDFSCNSWLLRTPYANERNKTLP